MAKPARVLLAELAGVSLPAPAARRLRADLAAAANARDIGDALNAARLVLVSRSSLAGFGVERPRWVIETLRRAGAVEPTGTHGVWRFVGGDYWVPDEFIASSLHVNRDSAMSWGRAALPQLMGWTKRFTGLNINVPPAQTVPAPLRSSSRRRQASAGVSRWEARAPFWVGRGLPMFAPATELTYIAAHPTHYNLIDLPEFLEPLCALVEIDELLVELEPLPRSSWMRACVLLQYGLRRDLADLAFAKAPPGSGPYYFVYEDRIREMAEEPLRAWYHSYQLYDTISPTAYFLQQGRRGAGADTPDDLRAMIESGLAGAQLTLNGEPEDLLV